jgi:4-carboxymuconolactone decarboxylase
MTPMKPSLLFLSISCVCASAFAQDRMPPIPAAHMTDAQKKAAEAMNAGRHSGVIGPYIPLMRSPKLLQQVYEMGGYLRFESPFKGRLTELVTLIAARHWTQQFEWNAHYPLALAAGLKQEIVTAIAEGRRPSSMAEDEEIVYDFCSELNANHSVSDALYARAVAKLGEQRVVDMIAVNGFYGMIAMLMNAARTPVLTRQAPPLVAFPH